MSGVVVAMDQAEARAAELFAHYLGVFTLNEPKREVEKRVERAIDLAIASLSLATRLIGKPMLKAVAIIPDSIEFVGTPAAMSVTFARKFTLEASLDGGPRHQKVVMGASADVVHRTRDGAIETHVYSDAGAVTNRYELDGDTLVGHVLMQSQHLPKDISYSVLLARRSR